jgi:hypothetical protein
VFTKLYGEDGNGCKAGIPFIKDDATRQQFIYELVTSHKLDNVELRKFPHTEAYNRCFTLPRTNESTEIESIVRSLAPFIYETCKNEKLIASVVVNGETELLSNYLSTSAAIYYMGIGKFVALCRPLVFSDMSTGKPFAHSTVERTLLACNSWLQDEFNLKILPSMAPIPGGFPHLQSRYRSSPAARFVIADKDASPEIKVFSLSETKAVSKRAERIGQRLRVNDKWKPDQNGQFETVNEMKLGVLSLNSKNENVAYMDTFLFEADDTTQAIDKLEKSRLSQCKTGSINAKELYAERLSLQESVAEDLFNKGIACRVVYSGAKSYHILVRVSDAPNTLDEYKWLHAQLAMELGTQLTFDASTSDPARLTRAPITCSRVTVSQGIQIIGTQTCLYADFDHVYDYSWRMLYEQWLNRPLKSYEKVKGKRLVPSKPEYVAAMQALLTGTFWTDSTFDGSRNIVFFPAYRLCRELGFSHAELWSDDGIMDNIDKYYHHNEIGYWKSREKSNLVSTIDSDFD